MGLSVIIPTFNRKTELVSLLSELPTNLNVEFVIVIDSDVDGTGAALQYAKSIHRLRVVTFTENRGRYHALVKGLENCSYRYAMFMDDDDRFTRSGLNLILRTIEKYRNYQYFIFPTDKTGIPKKFLMQEVVDCRYGQLRADLGVSGDLKEVFDVDSLRRYIPKFSVGLVRRVPTSLFWWSLGEHMPCLFFPPCLVVNKFYLKDGLSNHIATIKQTDSIPMVALNALVISSNQYSSKYFWFRSCVLLYRYIFHSLGAKSVKKYYPKFTPKHFFPMLLGGIAFGLDVIFRRLGGDNID